MWNPLSPLRRPSLREMLREILRNQELTMSALDDLKAAVAKNDLGVQHVADLLNEVADKLKADPDTISGDEIEEIATHLSAAADQLQGFTLTPPQTSGAPGAQTANQAPTAQADNPATSASAPDAGTPPTPATGVAS